MSSRRRSFENAVLISVFAVVLGLGSSALAGGPEKGLATAQSGSEKGLATAQSGSASKASSSKTFKRADNKTVSITRLDSSPTPTRRGLDAQVATELSDEELLEMHDGSFYLDVWSSDTAEANLALRFGGGHTYTFLAAGTDLSVAEPGEDRRYEVGAGAGIRGFIDEAFIDFDLSLYMLLDQGGSPLEAGMAKIRLGVGSRFSRYFAVSAGMTATLFGDLDIPTQDTTVAHPTYVQAVTYLDVEAPLRLALWPGFYAGMEF